MVPRFPSPLETDYVQMFPKPIFPVLAYMEACTPLAYKTLLQKAIKRKKEVTLEELIEVAGEEAYEAHKAYLASWGVTDA